MKHLLATMMVFCAASPALGWPSLSGPQPSQTPNPAVVRVTAIERSGASLGSGVLVAVDATHGLVITNWHVVRDSSGPILVSFPDGFASAATVLKTDHTWDLAALAIARPRAQPIPISTQPPRPGDALTIAGYGRDSYRAISGRCTEYLTPGGNNPAEMVEVDVAARQGDSGGPILNARGELAGVLFGSNDSFLNGQYTMGSYCGRVRLFVGTVAGDFQRLSTNPTMIAQQPAQSAAAASRPLVAVEPPPAPIYAETRPSPNYFQLAPCATPNGAISPSPQPVTVATVAQSPSAAASLPLTRAEQIKTILAAVGIFAILFHAIRLIGSAVG